MSKRNDRPKIHDPQADRLKRTGCLLTIAGPLLLLAYAAAVLTPALIEMNKPRSQQTVQNQSGHEILLLTANLDGEEGFEASDTVDLDLHHRITDNYDTGNLRAGRIDETPTDHAEALALAANYEASLIIWGESDGSTDTYHISVANPIGTWEAGEQVFELPAGDEFSEGLLVDYLYNQMSVHLAENGQFYRYSDASYGFYDLYHYHQGTVFFSPQTAAYLVYSAFHEDDQATMSETLAIALDEHPTTELLMLSAMVYSAMGDPLAAQEALNQAVDLDPTIGIDDSLRTRLLILEGYLDEALGLLDELIDEDPREVGYLLERARLHDALGNTDAANADYQAYLELLDDDHIVHFEYLNRLLDRGDWQLAEMALEDIPETIDWENPPPFSLDEQLALARIRLLLAEENTQQALLVAQDGIYDYTLLPAVTGLIHTFDGNEAEAEAAWHTDFLSYQGGLNELAWLLVTNGWPEEALPYAEEAIKTSSDPNTIHTLGYCQLKTSDYMAAIQNLEAAYMRGLDASYPQITADLGDAYLGAGDYETAIHYYTAFLSESSTSTMTERDLVLFRLAQARYRLLNEG